MALVRCTRRPSSPVRSARATAVLDRFLDHADVLTITGRRDRLRDRGGSPLPGKTASTDDGNERCSDDV